ncbi:MAG: tetratricopeptide repeat protein [Mucilaginibacter sp.]|nr:tetratricopeptide repeat protein [Mucilaginibacter sp.]
MFSNRARIFVLSVFAIMLVLFAYQHVYQLTAFCALMIIVIVFEYFKQGTLVLAAKYYHLKDYEKTEELLKQIRKPEWLNKKRRGFYEYMMGAICLWKHEFNAAEAHYELAAQYPLRTLNDHVAALVHVANISIRLGKYDKAEAYLQLALKDKEKITAKMLAVIDRLKQEIKKH